MTAIDGSAAAVTGAASGIGRALALELAARGCDLALADRDEAGLQSVAAEIGRDARRKVTTYRVDVADIQQIQEFATAATAAHPKLNIVINNAGVALLGQFNEVEQAQMEWLFDINFWGVVHATRAFLPHLAKKYNPDMDVIVTSGRPLRQELPDGAKFWTKPWAPLDVIREAEKMSLAWSHVGEA